ncbi:MAG: succinylglutamate desuccinylase/aspartoacylase family protein [Propionibacteriales bacterium]|nr:succinylglutamate desuccinylase/aspartoacylase family protein [Propionibacteriales bacterium]
MRSRQLALLASAAATAACLGVPDSSTASSPADLDAATTRIAAATSARPAVLSRRVIGYSVRGYPIRAFELGDRRATPTVVLVGSMHGNEKDGSFLISRLINGDPISGVHLWVIPRDNPDGFLRNVRHNSHGVDLNRNFPTRWRRLTGYYSSGARPSSEPETRALQRFLNRVDPRYLVTFHSPLHGVDVYGAKNRPFARRLATNLELPIKEFACSGVCHGTLTQWFNRNHRGACVTVEFGRSPSWRYLNVRAPRGFIRAVGGSR